MSKHTGAVLVFDTETTGIPRNWKAPVTDLANWPRLVQLAWQLHDGQGQPRASVSAIVRPEGFQIPEEAARVHGITTQQAVARGRGLREVLEEFAAAVEAADLLVAHNMRFDEKIVGAELLRTRVPLDLDCRPRVCTMLGATAYCGIPGKYGPKWPTLDELHRHLFGVAPERQHDAGADTAACAACFFELRTRGVIR